MGTLPADKGMVGKIQWQKAAYHFADNAQELNVQSCCISTFLLACVKGEDEEVKRSQIVLGQPIMSC